MPRLLALCLLLCPLLTWGQVYFNERYQVGSVAPFSSGATQVELADSGRYLIGGSCNDPLIPTMRALFLQRVEADGQVVQPSKRWGWPDKSLYPSYAGALFRVKGGGRAWAVSRGDAASGTHAMLWRLNEQDDTLWTRTYQLRTTNLPAYLVVRNACQLPDSGYVLVGNVERAPQSFNFDILVIRTDELGQELWRRAYPFLAYSEGMFVCATADSGCLVTGFTIRQRAVNPLDMEGVVLKLDHMGDIQWQRTFGGPYTDMAGPAVPMPDGGYLVSGSWSDSVVPPNYSQARATLIKLDQAGQQQWRRHYGPPRYGTNATCLLPLTDGSFLMGLHGGDTAHAISRGFAYPVGVLLNVCANGDSVWYRSYKKLTGGYSHNYFQDVTVTADGGFVSAGFLFPYAPDTGTSDAWLFKTDQYGYLQTGGTVPTVTCRPIGVEEEALTDPLVIYPNPNPSGRFILRLPATTHLTVTDALGRLVYHSPYLGGGGGEDGETELDLSPQPPGVYVLRLQWPNGRTATRKLLR